MSVLLYFRKMYPSVAIQLLASLKPLFQVEQTTALMELISQWQQGAENKNIASCKVRQTAAPSCAHVYLLH